ncbi:MAG: TetR family transcriptional regulator [Bradyrhizobiaceae bacterium]|uniref:TetR family transcriptional regulator n=1 Tax=unclassified Afipia TaxID=2642050 RepID=UPI000467CA4B|nr:MULTISPECIES: TetR family transcriptional regulator [unclassified Afipia]MAH69463.1 TetR family transcriptional regulator [Afipia sp.]OUX61453.1 MAG: TetR family transcriptional regulator [Afipia sp. TMED4]RTL83818.1 MAG: TetR family transcriptional regulator [Bradyrhizobiaceae bacterium]HAO40275.1 TetR family transcriptional regulator [Afipia sp.]HAP14302.1 TetR family transcriptional regulator [Afipia sp.]
MSPTLTAKKPRRLPSKQVPEKETAPMNATAAKLLVAAGDLMIERNSTEVSLSEIAQKSGVNAALVKYHFGNKDGLLLALLARDAAAEMTNLAFVLDQPISPTEKMRRHIAGIINAYYRVPYLSRLIHLLLHQGSEATSKEVHRFFIDPLFGFVRKLLDDGVAAGEFRKVDPALFYISLNGACDNLFYGRQMNARFLGPTGISDEVRRQYIKHMTTLFLGGLLTDRAAMSFDTEKSSVTKA